MQLIGTDFEFANNIRGSICAYGFAYEDGTKESGILHLHPDAGVQERSRYHGISAEDTEMGLNPMALYRRLSRLPEDAVLVAHDARIDRSQLNAWFKMWGLPPLDLKWIDSLGIAKRVHGKRARTGVAAMAERYEMTVKSHDPGDDALVALAVALRNPDDRPTPVNMDGVTLEKSKNDH